MTETKEKSTIIAYILLCIAGPFGGHKLYLEEWGIGIVYACTSGIFGIGLIVDFFTLGNQVAQYNNQHHN